jgi:hypothetical protein
MESLLAPLPIPPLLPKLYLEGLLNPPAIAVRARKYYFRYWWRYVSTGCATCTLQSPCLPMGFCASR